MIDYARASCLLFLGISLSLAKPITSELQIHESRSNVPTGFTLKGFASPDTVLNLRIALAQNDPGGLVDKLTDISTPSSQNYGKWLSREETQQYAAPRPESYDAVSSWLTSNGIAFANLTSTGQWLGFEITAKNANALLNAQFSTYVHDSSGTELVRTLEYSVPQNLKAHVDVVHPTTAFVAGLSSISPFVQPASDPDLKVRKTTVADDISASCKNAVTPACLQALYGIPTAPATHSSSNVLGVSGFVNEWVSNADLQQFLETFRPDISSSTTYRLVTIDGGQNPQTFAYAGEEANLDIQYTVGLATNVPVEFISVGTDNSDGIYGFLDQVQYLLEQETVPTVLSTSYAFDQSMLSRQMANTMCQAYASLTSRGTSLLFASGDAGPAGNHGESCTTFIDLFPSGCPFVTSVGATTSFSPETAATFSGGGFSNYFARPSWQNTQVETYLTAHSSLYSGLYNSSGRGYPDISAQGVNFDIILVETEITASGTSCSTPTVASIIALLNDQLIAAGKPVLGFLNPWLYSTAASALTDITEGNSPGCNTNGWSAASGWDPITGLGTPVFESLLKAAGV